MAGQTIIGNPRAQIWRYTKEFTHSGTNNTYGGWAYTITVSHPESPGLIGSGNITVDYTYNGHDLIIAATSALAAAEAVLLGTDPEDTAAVAEATSARDTAQTALNTARESATYITPAALDTITWVGGSLPKTLAACIRRIEQSFARAKDLAQYNAQGFLESTGYLLKSR